MSDEKEEAKKTYSVTVSLYVKGKDLKDAVSSVMYSLDYREEFDVTNITARYTPFAREKEELN